jgi:Mn2+/Fe2+ NRAMP family transporter
MWKIAGIVFIVALTCDHAYYNVVHGTPVWQSVKDAFYIGLSASITLSITFLRPGFSEDWGSYIAEIVGQAIGLSLLSALPAVILVLSHRSHDT